MNSKLSFVTQIPEDISEQDVIDCLHNHDIYIQTTCPQLISRQLTVGVPGLDSPCEYSIVDTRPLGETTFKLGLTNLKNGIDAIVECGIFTGTIEITSEWRVRDGKLEELVDIDGTFITRLFVRRNIEKEHPEFHQHLFTVARERQGSTVREEVKK